MIRGQISENFSCRSFRFPYPLYPAKFQSCPQRTRSLPMREIFRPAACALSVACLALAMSAISSSDVLAQAKQAPPKQAAPAQAAPPPQETPMKQIALTDKQIDGALAAAKEMDPITSKIP